MKPVCLVIAAGAVDAPDTLGKMLGQENFQKLRETQGMENDGLILPKKNGRNLFPHCTATPISVDPRARYAVIF